jgi:cholesterol transport system auxiliary component
MKNSIKVFMSICLMTFLSACSFKQNSLEINQYAIDFKLDKNISKSISKSIYIDEVNVNKSFDNHSIFYTTKAYLFDEYALNKWINKPSYMIYNKLLDVYDSKLNKDLEYVLKTNVTDLYNSIEGNKSYAILKIKFDLQLNKQSIKTYTYEKKILCQTNEPYGFVIAINQAFEEVVNDLSLQL